MNYGNYEAESAVLYKAEQPSLLVDILFLYSISTTTSTTAL